MVGLATSAVQPRTISVCIASDLSSARLDWRVYAR